MELYNWQKKAIAENEERNHYAFLADPGSGKTCAVINVLRQKYNANRRIMRTLIIAPSVTLYNWLNEIPKYSKIKRDDIEILKGSIAKRAETITKSRKNIFITNYEAFINEQFTNACIAKGIEVLILDESHYCKTPNTKRSRNIFRLSQGPKYKYIMTGTPITNNVTDIFMQFKILDGGKTFGDNFFIFQRKYMVDKNEAWKGRKNYFPKWVAREDKFDELQELIYRHGIRVTKEECMDLPPLIQKTVTIPLSTAQRRYYNQMMRDYIAFVEEGNAKGIITAELAVTKALRMQQIVTGYVQDEAGQIIEINDNPRLEAVENLLNDLHDKHKVILWCSFKPNYKQLERVCQKVGVKYVFLTGEQNTSQKAEAIEQFETDEATRVIIANRRAGGIGVNLVQASYSIVYSRNFSYEEEVQSTARNYRGGSQIHDRIVKIDLCAMDTLDEVITEALQTKKKIADAVIEYALKH